MAMGIKVKICSPLNARLLLILLAVATVFSVFWFLSTPSPDTVHPRPPEAPRGSLTGMEVQRSETLDQNQVLGAVAPMEVADTEYTTPFSQHLVHLDLKGAPPQVSYLVKLFPLLRKLGATGILLEYEDTFPYSGELEVISAGNAYSKSDVQKINSAAESNGLEIIPLVQTFGHLEFLLKLSDFQHLREVPELPLVVCPSQNQTLWVLRQMLSQVIQAHPRSKRVHIGSDEVYQDMIGKCRLCRERMVSRYWSNSDLFLSHVVNVALTVRDELKLRPLMWDDEFRSIAESDLHRSGVGRLVDIVVWNYTPVLQLPAETWTKYLNVFSAIWVASAFKGATGSDQVVTDINYHMQNHLSWVTLASQYRNSRYRHKFAGIMLTGWSRYDHFAVLCELLPVSLPSLAYNLLLLRYGYDMNRINSEVAQLLQCRDAPVEFLLSNGPSAAVVQCQFPGAQVFTAVQNFVQVRQQYYRLQNNSVVRGWLTDYNVERSFSSPVHLRGLSTELTYLKAGLEASAADCRVALHTIYDPSTVSEWIDTHVQPVLKAVDRWIEAAESLLSRTVWPKRPLDH